MNGRACIDEVGRSSWRTGIRWARWRLVSGSPGGGAASRHSGGAVRRVAARRQRRDGHGARQRHFRGKLEGQDPARSYRVAWGGRSPWRRGGSTGWHASPAGSRIAVVEVGHADPDTGRRLVDTASAGQSCHRARRASRRHRPADRGSEPVVLYVTYLLPDRATRSPGRGAAGVRAEPGASQTLLQRPASARARAPSEPVAGHRPGWRSGVQRCERTNEVGPAEAADVTVRGVRPAPPGTGRPPGAPPSSRAPVRWRRTAACGSPPPRSGPAASHGCRLGSALTRPGAGPPARTVTGRRPRPGSPAAAARRASAPTSRAARNAPVKASPAPVESTASAGAAGRGPSPRPALGDQRAPARPA